MNKKIYYFFKYHFFIKSRTFVKHIFRKYVLWYDYWTMDKLSKRQERQNNHFKWTKENIEKIKSLNQYLTNLMEDVYSDCQTLEVQHDKWISEGKDCYKNYEIKGYIIHRETDCDNYGIRKTNFTDAQDDVTDDTSWCIRFSDSSHCKTELSKENQSRNFKRWDSSFLKGLFPVGETSCAFLDAFLYTNKGYSLKDFVKMTKENFCKSVEVHYAS